MKCKWEDAQGVCTHKEISVDGVRQPCVKGPCPHEKLKYPTREQVERIISGVCSGEGCCQKVICDIADWCIPNVHLDCGRAMLAMHDEIDRLNALVQKVVTPTRDADGFYLCECGLPVGCDGTHETIKYLKRAYCADCGARISWDGIQVWVWTHGGRIRIIPEAEEVSQSRS